MKRSVRIGILLALILVGGAVRLWPSVLPYCELDGAIYTRTALELTCAIQSGLLWQQPFDGSHYCAIDYWPPLFPVLGALFGSPAIVSAWTGALLAWPVFLLARALFSGEDWRVGKSAGTSLDSAKPALQAAAGSALSDAAKPALQDAAGSALSGAAKPALPDAAGSALSGAAKPALPDASGPERDALWWADCSALLAAALVAFHPYLAWLGRTPHCEPLYLFLVAFSSWLGLRPRAGCLSWLGSGVVLGAAYTARFDGLAMLPALLLAVGWWRGWRGAVWVAVGFGLGALPYLAYISWLSGGDLALAPPRKVLYDAMEGVYVQVFGWKQFDYSCAFGMPGCFSFAGHEAEVQRLLDEQLPSLLSAGWLRLPANLCQGQILWVWVSVPVLLSLVYWRDRRLQALLLCCLPVLGMSLFQEWDIAPRYYAFTLIFLSVLAAKGLEFLARSVRPAANWRWIVASVALPLWLAIAWTVPSLIHFDQHGPVDGAWGALLPNAESCRWLALAAGLGISALLTRYMRSSWAGVLGTLLAWGVAGGAVVAAREGASAPLEWWQAGTIAVLLLLPAALYCSQPSRRWGFSLWRWTVICWLVLAGGSLLTLEVWSVAHGRILYNPSCVGYLREQSAATANKTWEGCPAGARAGFGNGGPRVLALQQLDSMLGEARWLPWPPREEVRTLLEREQPDFIVAAFPDPQRFDDCPVTSVPELMATGRVELVANFAVPGGGCLQRWWRVYRLAPKTVRSSLKASR